MGNLDKTHRLKSLNVSADKLRSTIRRSRDEIKSLEGNIKDAEKRLPPILEEIEFIKSDKTVTCSEHAILRYLERYTYLSLDDICIKIMKLPPEKLVRRGNTIVTILNDGERNDTYVTDHES